MTIVEIVAIIIIMMMLTTARRIRETLGSSLVIGHSIDTLQKLNLCVQSAVLVSTYPKLKMRPIPENSQMRTENPFLRKLCKYKCNSSIAKAHLVCLL